MKNEKTKNLIAGLATVAVILGLAALVVWLGLETVLWFIREVVAIIKG